MMPILVIAGIGIAGISFLGGYVTSGGVKSASDGIKYAVLGATAFIVAKQAGWIK